MSAPDHRPYLIATDLRTAEDAAWWLRIDRTERLKAYRQDGGRGVFPCDADLLYARIDRERRQACRRGARYEITMARAFWRAGGGVQALLARAHVERAFAFRAAARQR